MRKGIFAFFGYTMSLKKRFELIKSTGFDSVMIWWGKGEGKYEGTKQEYRPLADKYGIYISNAHLPFRDSNNLWRNSNAGTEYAEYVCRQIEECAESQIPTVVLHLSMGIDPPHYNPVGLERMKNIVGTAERHGVHIALENLRYVEYLDYVFSNIDSPNLGFCFDNGHSNSFTPGINVLKKYGKHLIELHLNDNVGASDEHLLPFDGSSDWNSIINTLRDLRYDKIISLEVHQDMHDSYKDFKSEEFLALAFERACEIEHRLKV